MAAALARGLEDARLVERGEGVLQHDDHARVARKALELSSGYTERTMIVKVAAPIALATTRKIIKWPLAIGPLAIGPLAIRPLAIGPLAGAAKWPLM